jgi:hypothetical protein
MSLERNFYGAQCLSGELSMGRDVHGRVVMGRVVIEATVVAVQRVVRAMGWQNFSLG